LENSSWFLLLPDTQIINRQSQQKKP